MRVRDVLAECGLDVDGMALGKTRHPHLKMVCFVLVAHTAVYSFPIAI